MAERYDTLIISKNTAKYIKDKLDFMQKANKIPREHKLKQKKIHTNY